VLATLAEHPEIGPRWEHAGSDDRIRRIPLARYPFVMFYVVGSESVRVLAVAHTSRRPEYWIERLLDHESALV
jgi:plasmid stabilization system protein ParE